MAWLHYRGPWLDIEQYRRRGEEGGEGQGERQEEKKREEHVQKTQPVRHVDHRHSTRHVKHVHHVHHVRHTHHAAHRVEYRPHLHIFTSEGAPAATVHESSRRGREQEKRETASRPVPVCRLSEAEEKILSGTGREQVESLAQVVVSGRVSLPETVHVVHVEEKRQEGEKRETASSSRHQGQGRERKGRDHITVHEAGTGTVHRVESHVTGQVPGPRPRIFTLMGGPSPSPVTSSTASQTSERVLIETGRAGPGQVAEWTREDVESWLRKRVEELRKRYNIVNIARQGEYIVVKYRYHGKNITLLVDSSGHVWMRDAAGNLVPAPAEVLKSFATSWKGYVTGLRRLVSEAGEKYRRLLTERLRELQEAELRKLEEIAQLVAPPPEEMFSPGPHAPPDVRVLAAQEAREWALSQIETAIQIAREHGNERLVKSLQVLKNLLEKGSPEALKILNVLAYVTDLENYPITVPDYRKKVAKEIIPRLVQDIFQIVNRYGTGPQALKLIEEKYVETVRELYQEQAEKYGPITVGGEPYYVQYVEKFKSLLKKLTGTSPAQVYYSVGALAHAYVTKNVLELLTATGLAEKTGKNRYTIRVGNRKITVTAPENVSKIIEEYARSVKTAEQSISKYVTEIGRHVESLRQVGAVSGAVKLVEELGVSGREVEKLEREVEKLRREVEAGRYAAEWWHRKFAWLGPLGAPLETVASFVLGLGEPLAQAVRPDSALYLRSMIHTLERYNPWAARALSAGTATGVGLYGWFPETVEAVSRLFHHPVLSGYTERMHILESALPGWLSTGIEIGVGILPAVLTGGAYLAGRLGASLAARGLLATAARLGEVESALLRAAETLSWIYPETPLLEAAGRFLTPRIAGVLARVGARLPRRLARLLDLLSYTHVEVPAEVRIGEVGPGTYSVEVRTVRVPVPHELRFETPVVYTGIIGERAGEIYHIPVHPFTERYRMTGTYVPSGRYRVLAAMGVGARGRMYVPGLGMFEILERQAEANRLVHDIVMSFLAETGHTLSDLYRSSALREALLRWVGERYGREIQNLVKNWIETGTALHVPVGERFAALPHVEHLLQAAQRGMEVGNVRIASTFYPKTIPRAGTVGYYPMEVVASPERMFTAVRHVYPEDIYRLARSELATVQMLTRPESGLVMYRYGPAEIRLGAVEGGIHVPASTRPAPGTRTPVEIGKTLPENVRNILTRPITELSREDIENLVKYVVNTYASRVPGAGTLRRSLEQILERIVNAAREGRPVPFRTGEDLLDYARRYVLYFAGREVRPPFPEKLPELSPERAEVVNRWLEARQGLERTLERFEKSARSLELLLERGRFEVPEEVGQVVERVVRELESTRPIVPRSVIENVRNWLETVATRLLGEGHVENVEELEPFLRRLGEMLYEAEIHGRGLEMFRQVMEEIRQLEHARPIEETVAEIIREGAETGRVGEAVLAARRAVLEWLRDNIVRIIEEALRRGLTLEEAVIRVIEWLERERLLHPDLDRVIDRIIQRALDLLSGRGITGTSTGEGTVISTSQAQLPSTIAATATVLAQAQTLAQSQMLEMAQETGQEQETRQEVKRPRVPELEIPWLWNIVSRLFQSLSRPAGAVREVLVL